MSSQYTNRYTANSPYPWLCTVSIQICQTVCYVSLNWNCWDTICSALYNKFKGEVETIWSYCTKPAFALATTHKWRIWENTKNKSQDQKLLLGFSLSFSSLLGGHWMYSSPDAQQQALSAHGKIKMQNALRTCPHTHWAFAPKTKGVGGLPFKSCTPASFAGRTSSDASPAREEKDDACTMIDETKGCNLAGNLPWMCVRVHSC